MRVFSGAWLHARGSGPLVVCTKTPGLGVGEGKHTVEDPRVYGGYGESQTSRNMGALTPALVRHGSNSPSTSVERKDGEKKGGVAC